ncbi:uncharacterized protein LOC126705325 isoform X1 [Quercus robur]|uniref:uncharacterized protein LOC126705325 isoform X1 n=1 Tax=Quercus robur TaxID=38942 RepID=UPI002162353F|nr:uncharacterized protein LOC126705325 isoform X1 [Quercus robur]XP_050260190.1 uncharacterized protein LOC126705325 isoform X1 [Quercus robur]
MNELFTLHVHHGGHFMWNPQAYVGGTVDIVDNCDPDRWSKVEIESICRDFGYSEVDKLWYKMPGVDPERSNFHQVVDDDAAMFMTDLVKGYGEIHVFVEHPVHEPVELPVEDFDPLAAAVPGSEVEGVGVEVFASDRVLQNDNEEYRPDFSQFGGHDDAEFVNEEVCARRAGKAPVVDDQVEESSEGSDGAYLGSEGSEGSEDERSDLEEEAEAEAEPEVQPMNIGEDSPDSWDNQAENAEVEAGQMGGGVMNSDYESEELLSLDESSSGSEGGDDSSDDDIPVAEVDNSIRSSKYPIFRPVAKAENLRFEKDMLFISAKQFKDAITDYAVHGGWGIKFVKNDLVKVRARCQPGCNFVAYLAKVPREKSFRLKTLNMEHTCSRSYRNPRCTASYIGKKLVKRVRRQPGIKLKDIQEAVHEKYVVDISAGKASRARERAQDAVDGTHTA